MDRGDYVLCAYDNTYHYVARVLAKHNNPQFVEIVWGYDDKGQTWQYMYLLTKPMKVDRHVSEFENHLHKSYRGFTAISDERLEAIAEEYGSVEQFINCTVAAQGPCENLKPSSLLQIFPAKAKISGVDPTRLELVTSAMRRRHSPRESHWCQGAGASFNLILRLRICPANRSKRERRRRDSNPRYPV
jgi:hypothetical protein